MANPQCENGYIRIASELWEALCRIRIPGEARQVLDVIFRKTYGYHKKEDAISLSQFVLATGITKPNICQALKKLKEMNLITQKDNKIANFYSINKDYGAWKPLPKKITPLPKTIMINENNQQIQGIAGDESITQNHNGGNSLPKTIMTITQNHNASLPKTLHTIDNTTKDNITKDRSKVFIPPSLDEVKRYIADNNYHVNAENFMKYFTEGNWIDSNGKKVRNWKQKIITWEGRNVKKKLLSGVNLSEDFIENFSKGYKNETDKGNNG